MIPYKIFPHFELGFLHINMYGIMFASGLLLAVLLAKREAEKRGADSGKIYDMFFWLIIGVMLGARLFYVLFYWPDGLELTFFRALQIWKGGLSFFGGLFGAATAGCIYIRKHKLNFWLYADIFAVPLVAGHILGRLGDWFTGGHPGKLTQLPWAIHHEGALRHPVVLYEITGLVVILGLLFMLRKAKQKHDFFNGFLFLSYAMLYSVQRFMLDFLRAESETRHLMLTPSQYITIFLFAIALVLMLSKFIKRRSLIQPA